jgi:hypothetical protein
LKKASLTTTLNDIKAREHPDYPLREAQRQRRPVKVRRVAMIRPAGTHFRLLPILAT